MSEDARTALIAKTNEVFGDDWYQRQSVEKAKADIDSTITKKITGTSTPEQIQALIENPDAKKLFDTYFTYPNTANPYVLTTPDGKKTITINKLTGPTQSYI